MLIKSLAVGIVFLFVFSTVTSMVVGFDFEHEIKSQNLLVYDSCNKTINIDYKEDIDIPNNIILVEDEEEFLEQMSFLSYSESDIDVRYNYYKEKILQENFEVAENNEIKIKKLKSLSNNKSGGLMESSWPMRNHDMQHTGRSPYSTENVTGLEKWRFCNRRQGWGGLEGGPIIDNEGIIYFGDSDHCVYAVYPNGTMKWQTELTCMIKSTPAIDENGILYIGTVVTTTNFFYAIYTNNGTIKWKYRIGYDDVFSSPVISNDGTIIFGDNNNGINALNPNGTLKWRFKTDGPVYSSPVIGEDGTIYCGCHVTSPNYKGRLYALNQNGTLRWKYNASHWVRVAPCIGDDGIVYFGSLDGYLHAAYPNNGTLKWKIKFPDGNTYPAVGHDGTIYAGLDKLRAIYPENGTIKWKFEIGDQKIEGGGPIISEDGTIYFGTRIGETSGGNIIAINANGTLKWQKKICDDWIDSSLAIGEDGTVYIGSRSEGGGFLHAFGPVESNEPPETPTISGEINGKPMGEYWYRFVVVEPDNNPFQLYIDWGDGTNSGWTREHAPHDYCWYKHTWLIRGKYTIRVKAKDVMGAESNWGTLEVSMPKNKIINPFERFLENHPYMFPILRHLMGV